MFYRLLIFKKLRKNDGIWCFGVFRGRRGRRLVYFLLIRGVLGRVERGFSVSYFYELFLCKRKESCGVRLVRVS